jgi:hypothetical protein
MIFMKQKRKHEIYTVCMLRDAVLVFRFQAKPVDDDDTLKLNKSNLYTMRSSVVLLYITLPLRQNHND